MAKWTKWGLGACAAAACMVSLPAGAQTAPDAAGNWYGPLTAPTGSMTLVVYVTRNPDGSLKGELESRDQAPGKRIPLSDVAVADGHLRFRVPAIGASYDGTWTPADKQWHGTFTQGVGMALALAQGVPPPKPVVAGLDGNWSGSFERNGVHLRQVLHVATTPDLGTSATMDAPDQLAFGLALTALAHEGDAVRFATGQGAHFAGTLSPDGKQIAGKWTVPGQPDIAVTFVRGDTPLAAAAPPPRPQTPRPPFPYRAEDVAFDNPQFKDVHLAGTLTLPQGKGPFPAAVLITGSGGQDRDETMLGHKPFAVIADYLTRRGFAVLRVDDRGVGKSTGDYGAATSADLATDANAGFAYLRTRPDIRREAIGMIGHSEGGMIGPIAMASNPDVAFLVMLAGPGTALDKLMLSQRRLVGAQMGVSQADLDKAEPVMAAVFHAIQAAPTTQAGHDAAMALMTPEAKKAVGMPPEMDGAILVNQVSGPWFQYFLKYDPAPNLARIRVPVLALDGSLDRQVPPEANLAAIRAATANNPDVTAIELPGLNHLFQPAKTGAVGEYADIETTVAPAALQTMGDWLVKRFVKP